MINSASRAELRDIPVQDSEESLVVLNAHESGFVVSLEKTSRSFQHLDESSCFVRETVARMLHDARSNLPKGLTLKIVDAYRPPAAQEAIWNELHDQLKKEHLNWSELQLNEETNKWVAPLDSVPPHTTGGAIDLTLVNDAGEELNMGTLINSTVPEAETLCKSISPLAKKNREILIRALSNAGFVNYGREWWHWSYGDKRWAAALHKKTALYGTTTLFSKPL